MMKKKIEKYIRFTRLKYAAASMLDKYILKQLIEVFILGVIRNFYPAYKTNHPVWDSV